jgi:flavin-dependent dehydrogenase
MAKGRLRPDLAPYFADKMNGVRQPMLRLENKSRVAVMGGGPAGSFFAYFLLDLAARTGLELQVDIYEPRDFNKSGSAGCNMCAGIISETLIQALALDGINLPAAVIQRGMDSYVLHNDVGQVRLVTHGQERRIGAVFRGVGPRGGDGDGHISFDGFMLGQALVMGANHIRSRVVRLERSDNQLRLTARGVPKQVYDFLAVATGVNTNALRLFEPLGIQYRPPRLAQTFIREYYLGEDLIQDHFGHTIHFFLLDLPGLNFAAIVPKQGFVTICLLGSDLKLEHFDAFVGSPQVKSCMPVDWQGKEFSCHCSPRINLTGASHVYAERMVFLGDCGISRLYKDGIGAAYRAAKAAAITVVFRGISESDLASSFGHVSQTMENDNLFGKAIFKGIDFLKPRRTVGRVLIMAIKAEQRSPGKPRPMSDIVWDLFTGSAPYRDVFYRLLNPLLYYRILGYLVWSMLGEMKNGKRWAWTRLCRWTDYHSPR